MTKIGSNIIRHSVIHLNWKSPFQVEKSISSENLPKVSKMTINLDLTKVSKMAINFLTNPKSLISHPRSSHPKSYIKNYLGYVSK